MSSENKFELFSYDEYLSNVTIINSKHIEYYIWLHIPHEFARTHKLFAIDVLQNSHCKQTYTIEHYERYISRECMHPWLKLNTTMLGVTSGYHCYKLSFIDINTNDIESLYFAYTIQDDNPETPYIYMNKYRTFKTDRSSCYNCLYKPKCLKGGTCNELNICK